MKTSWKDESVAILMLLAMFVIAAMMWSRVPDRVPVHWGWAGQVNRMGGRFEGLFVLPLAALGVYVLLLVLPRIDPRRAHYSAFASPYRTIRMLMVAMLFDLQLVIVPRLSRPDVPLVGGPVLVLAIMVIVLGNFLPKIQSNWFVGVRTPWTLSSEESWRRTHRLAGWLFVIAGVVTIAITLLWPRAGMVVLLTSLMTSAAVSVVYSYLVWRRDPSKALPSQFE
jgi:immunity protein, SdpI family